MLRAAMRLSIDPHDPAYDMPAAMFCRVTLDGLELNNCVTADEELGEAIVLETNTAGTLIIQDGEVIRKTLRGLVRIELDALRQEGRP